MPEIDRRAMVRAGVLTAGALVVAAGSLPAWPALACGERAAAPGRALVGWLVVDRDNRISARLVVLGDDGLPDREIAAPPDLAASSLAEGAQRLTRRALGYVAAAWNVQQSECACSIRGIEHVPSGRSVPFAIWTDFA